MEPLGFFLAGALVGAVCMHYSHNKVLIAAANERRRAEKRENRLTDERNAYQAAAESWKHQITDMRIEQANSAGYIDGYNSARHEMEAEQSSDFAIDTLTKGFRDGKRVSWTVINH